MKRVTQFFLLVCLWTGASAGFAADPIALEIRNADSTKELQSKLFVEKLTGRLLKRWRTSAQALKPTKLSLEIAKNGELKALSVSESSGNEKVDDEALDAIRNSAPFSPSPLGETIQLTATFDSAAHAPTAPPQGDSSSALQGYVDDAGERVAYDAKIAQIAAQANVPIRQPFQLNANKDAEGTPLIPQWRLDAGYDVLLGRFYVGFIAVDRPPLPVVLVSQRIERQWRGVQPNPCHLRLFKMHDGSGGYYFICLENRFGPCGWLMPVPKTEPGAQRWAVYYAQQKL